MSRRARVLRSAARDLTEIALYLRADAPDTAERILDDLVTHIERLAELPESAPLPRDERLRRLGFRTLSRGRYLVFFKLVGREVRVYRVLHARRAYERLL